MTGKSSNTPANPHSTMNVQHLASMSDFLVYLRDRVNSVNAYWISYLTWQMEVYHFLNLTILLESNRPEFSDKLFQSSACYFLISIRVRLFFWCWPSFRPNGFWMATLSPFKKWLTVSKKLQPKERYYTETMYTNGFIRFNLIYVNDRCRVI